MHLLVKSSLHSEIPSCLILAATVQPTDLQGLQVVSFSFFPKDIGHKIQRSHGEAVSRGLSCVGHRSGHLGDEWGFTSLACSISSGRGGSVSMSKIFVLVRVGLSTPQVSGQDLSPLSLLWVSRTLEYSKIPERISHSADSPYLLVALPCSLLGGG